MPEGWGLNFDYNIPLYCTNRTQRGESPKRRLSGVECLKWLLYADDLVFFARDTATAKIILETLDSVCKRYGLTISYAKTKSQVFGDVELATAESLFSVAETAIENVSDFVYLGHTISREETPYNF